VVEVSQSPSGVACPSSFWNTHRNRAPSGVAAIDNPSPWYCLPATAPIWPIGIGSDFAGAPPGAGLAALGVKAARKIGSARSAAIPAGFAFPSCPHGQEFNCC